jgi:hypothetical protein
MPRKKKEETLDDTLKEMAEALKEHGENNLAIVLYTYLGSRKIGLDGFFAKHCQEFAKEQLPEIQKTLKRKNN